MARPLVTLTSERAAGRATGWVVGVVVIAFAVAVLLSVAASTKPKPAVMAPGAAPMKGMKMAAPSTATPAGGPTPAPGGPR